MRSMILWIAAVLLITLSGCETLCNVWDYGSNDVGDIGSQTGDHRTHR